MLAQWDWVRYNDTARPVAYASRTFTDHLSSDDTRRLRRRLAVVWACERFHIYLHGKPFTLHTDHNHLNIFTAPSPNFHCDLGLDGGPALRLQPYQFNIVHMAGKKNPADVLSRLPLEN